MTEEPMGILRRMVDLRRDEVRARMPEKAAFVIADMANRNLLQSSITVAKLVKVYALALREIASAWRESLQELHDKGAISELPLPRNALLEEAADFVRSTEDAFRREIVERLERLSIPALAPPFDALSRASNEGVRHFQNQVDLMERGYRRQAATREPDGVALDPDLEKDRVSRTVAWARRHPLLSLAILAILVLGAVLPVANGLFELTDKLRHLTATHTTASRSAGPSADSSSVSRDSLSSPRGLSPSH